MICHTESINARTLGVTARQNRVAWLRLSAVALLLTACGGSSPPPPASATQAQPAAPAVPAVVSTAATPPIASTGAQATAAQDKANQDAPKTDDSASTAASTTTAHETSPEPAMSPTAVLTAARVAFLIDYGNSEAKVKAQAKCEKDPKKEDPAAKAACLDKARTQFLPDVLVFKSDKKGHSTLTIYKRDDSNLKVLFEAPVSLKDEGSNAVQVKFKGGGSGQRPLFKNSNSPTLKMPNSYTLEIDDSEHGTLRYDAKIGLVD